MLICIDSNVFIRSIQKHDPVNTRILDLVSPDLKLVLPRLVVQEVLRNLFTPNQVRRFYQLFRHPDIARIIDEPVPVELVNKYVVVLDAETFVTRQENNHTLDIG